MGARPYWIFSLRDERAEAVNGQEATSIDREFIESEEFSDLRSGFLTSAAARGASVFKQIEVPHHKSEDTLRGYIGKVEIFEIFCIHDGYYRRCPATAPMGSSVLRMARCSKCFRYAS